MVKYQLSATKVRSNPPKSGQANLVQPSLNLGNRWWGFIRPSGFHGGCDARPGLADCFEKQLIQYPSKGELFKDQESIVIRCLISVRCKTMGAVSLKRTCAIDRT